MKILSIIFILLFLNSCSTKNVIGIYGKCEKHYYACNQIELNPDGSYEYFNFEDVGGEKISKGRWKLIEKNKVILNSEIRPINPKIFYIGKTNIKNKNTYRITISDNGISLGFAGIVINDGELKGVTNEKGIFEFNKTKVNSIKYNYLNQTEIIYVKNTEFNEIEIFTKDIINHNFFIFVDKVAIFSKNKLIFEKDSNSRQFELKKTNRKNKQ